MFKRSKESMTMLLAMALIAFNHNCNGIELNLTEICSGLRSRSCVLFDIRASFEEPFFVKNSSQVELNELIIRDTVLVRFPREIFQQAPNLHTFVMDNTGVNRISTNDLESASQLHTLILQRNRLSDITEKVFSAVSLLKKLSVGQNNIHMVHQRAFFGLKQLKHLDLRQNAIHQLSQNLFSPLTNLEYLDLSSNSIAKIDSSTFEQNTRLSTLLLNNNKFTVFEPNSLQHIPHLTLLDISNSALEELNLLSVDTFYVQNSSLKHCQIGGVVKFHASNNELKSLNITDKIFVHELVLHGNLFESVDDFVEMVNLERLDLSKNYIKTLANFRSPLMLSLPSLSYLNLAFNKLTNLTFENLMSLTKLTHLDVSFNHLSGLDAKIFEPLRDLEKFYIAGNGLHYFDYRKFFETHPFIKEVDLNSNSWDLRLMREMLGFLKERSVLSTHHYFTNMRDKFYTTSNPVELRQHDTSSEPTSHHTFKGEDCKCLSSRSDILLIATFILAFTILALQIWRILRERNCFSLRWQRNTFRFGQPWQAQPPDESLSEV